MKKLLLMLLALSLGASALRAQDSGSGRSITPNAGSNVSKFSEEEVEGSESLLCPCLGVEVVLHEQGPVQIASGLWYLRSGSGYTYGEDFGEGESYSSETRAALSYLDVPVEARYEFGTGNVKPFVRGGGMLGILLSAKSKTTTHFGDNKNSDETDIKNLKKSTNFGVMLGGGVSFPLGNIAAWPACVTLSVYRTS